MDLKETQKLPEVIETDVPFGETKEVSVRELLMGSGMSSSAIRRTLKARARQINDGKILLDFTRREWMYLRIGKQVTIIRCQNGGQLIRERFPVFTVWECGCYKNKEGYCERHTSIATEIQQAWKEDIEEPYGSERRTKLPVEPR